MIWFGICLALVAVACFCLYCFKREQNKLDERAREPVLKTVEIGEHELRLHMENVELRQAAARNIATSMAIARREAALAAVPARYVEDDVSRDPRNDGLPASQWNWWQPLESKVSDVMESIETMVEVRLEELQPVVIEPSVTPAVESSPVVESSRVESVAEKVRDLPVAEPVEPAAPVGYRADRECLPMAVGEAVAVDHSSMLGALFERFSVTVTIRDRSVGATNTRYRLALGRGVRVRDVVGLASEVELSLPGASIIESAGDGLMAVDVPNIERATVHLGPLLDGADGLTVPVGVDQGGDPVLVSLADMPHLLVAGTTGSGKSGFINNIIVSLLMQDSRDVSLTLVDPKMVEFAPYRGVPHLSRPVITDMNDAADMLDDLVAIMESRYTAMMDAGYRSFSSYREVSGEPYHVVIFDEFADLMLQQKGIDKVIARLAAKARAAGIHIVLATQRPSADVVTGLIKSNIPSRVGMAVASHVDAGVMGVKGAERLLGKGDGLFSPVGVGKPVRFQSAWLDDDSIRSVVDSIKEI